LERITSGETMAEMFPDLEDERDLGRWGLRCLNEQLRLVMAFLKNEDE
jgi:hypothetical protein